jgi:chromatin remodeling complex protein RSC6
MDSSNINESDSSVVVDKKNDISYIEILDSISSNNKEIKEKLKENERYHKDLEKIFKSFEKKIIRNSKKKKSGNKGGLSIPITVSTGLVKMLELDSDVSSRSQITSLMAKYIKNNDLKDPVKKKFIKPNSAFLKLLKKKLDDGKLINLTQEEIDGLTHMNYQRYFQHNFTKIE